MNDNPGRSDEKTKSKGNLIKKVSVIAVSTLLGLGFVGNVVYAVFSGGEFTKQEEGTVKTAGLLRVEKAKYVSSYFAGDSFQFDKEKSQVSLVAKDKAISELVKIDSLPSPEYGFMAAHYEDQSGNKVKKSEMQKETDSTSEDGSDKKEEEYKEVLGEYHKEASEIQVDAYTDKVYVVSDMYQNLMAPLDIDVIDGSIDESRLVDSITYEAESADVYKDGVLLSSTDLESMPDSEKPFRSDKGNSTLDEATSSKLSGKACLRNFQSYNMKVDFKVVANKSCTVKMTIQYCTRTKDNKKFSSYYKVSVNGDSYSGIDNQSTVKGKDFYTPEQLEAVDIQLNKGMNHIVFESGTDVGCLNPVNLDAVFFQSGEKSIGTMDAIAYKDRK